MVVVKRTGKFQSISIKWIYTHAFRRTSKGVLVPDAAAPARRQDVRKPLDDVGDRVLRADAVDDYLGVGYAGGLLDGAAAAVLRRHQVRPRDVVEEAALGQVADRLADLESA